MDDQSHDEQEYSRDLVSIRELVAIATFQELMLQVIKHEYYQIIYKFLTNLLNTVHLKKKLTFRLRSTIVLR